MRGTPIISVVVLLLWFLVAQQSDSLAAQQRSVAAQISAIRKRAKLPVKTVPAFFVMQQAEENGPCEALPPMRVGRLVEDAAKRTGLDAGLIHAVMEQESAFRPCAVSHQGARGLMQLMPATMEQFGVTDAFDPEQNVGAGASLLKNLMTRYAGDLNRVLGAYNAGTARVDQSDGVPMIPETMNYVERILGRLSAPER